MTKRQLIEIYFQARTDSNASLMREIFTLNAEIYNVYLPVFRGEEGIRQFCEDFHRRIASCSFEIVDVLEGDDLAMVEWKATLTYKQGSHIGSCKLATSFTIQLRGMNRFDFENDKIKTLRVYHETTTVTNAIKEHSAPTPQ